MDNVTLDITIILSVVIANLFLWLGHVGTVVSDIIFFIPASLFWAPTLGQKTLLIS